MTPLPIARYRLTARVLRPLTLPDYAGSLLRGQFGAALRDVACMTRQATCQNCPLISTCTYTRIFEAPAPPKGQHALQDFSKIPNPYIVEPPTPGPGERTLDANDDFEFHLVLIGCAIEQLALLIFAMQRALARGLTRSRVPVDLLQVDWMDEHHHPYPIWSIDKPILQEHNATLPWPDGLHFATESEATNTDSSSARGQKASEISLHIHTPIRLQHQGRPLGIGQLHPKTLMAAIARRTALLMEFHAGQTDWGAAARHITHVSERLTDTRELHWFDWTRYSSRQQQEMTLGGVLGRWTLHGDEDTLSQIQPWLWLGQWLHVGKNATMGLGGYRLHAQELNQKVKQHEVTTH
jgi:hypothetical protein